MRTLKKNEQTLYYANYAGEIPVYATDDDGNIITTPVDGIDEPVVDSYIQGYETPIEIEANISFNSGESVMAEYGLDIGQYNAVINATKGKFPFNEQTLIWHTSEPIYSDGHVVPESADYRVIAIKTSLNEERFILRKRVDDGSGKPTPSA
jgi:hypothetical protein